MTSAVDTAPDAPPTPSRIARLGEAARRWTALAADAARPVVAAIRKVTDTISRLGRLTLALAAVFGVAGYVLAWRELRIAGLGLFLLVVLGGLFSLGRMKLAVGLDVEPLRLVAGNSAAARLSVRNAAQGLILPMGLELPVGESAARFTLPVLRPEASHEELVVIPTVARGVIVVGPVRTQRGDPFGLVRREVEWTEAVELFVHPRTIQLDELGAGLLRDLEGKTTNDVSMSDLAFHTLREYVPGDDRRYIHWRSSAKVSGASGQSQFLVRQFLDTRRSHLAIVVDVDETAYSDSDEFELAVSTGASIAVRALIDEMDLTIVCGEHSIDDPAPHRALDTFSRATFEKTELARATGRLNTLAPDASIVVLVTGAHTDFDMMRRSRAYLPPEARLVVLQVEQGANPTLREAGGLTVMRLGDLGRLPALLRGGITQ